jgi:23S rRNA (uracil1939-C5)-methyltransferase
MKYSQQLYYKQNEVLNHLQHWKSGASEFESILGSEVFYRNKMEFSFSNSRWLTEKEIGSTEEETETHLVSIFENVG